MSQKQAASLLACAFFCLFPGRSEHDLIKDYQNFQNPNFNRSEHSFEMIFPFKIDDYCFRLYNRGPREKMEKLKCILHYFDRVTRRSQLHVLLLITFIRMDLSSAHWCDYLPMICFI